MVLTAWGTVAAAMGAEIVAILQSASTGASTCDCLNKRVCVCKYFHQIRILAGKHCGFCFLVFVSSCAT